MKRPLRILLADDHVAIRRGISNLLRSELHFEIVAEAENGEAAVQLARELAPDLVVMDIEMPVMTGIEATALITANGGPKVIGLSASDHESACAMLNAGASDFVPKARAFVDLPHVIERLFPSPGGL